MLTVCRPFWALVLPMVWERLPALTWNDHLKCIIPSVTTLAGAGYIEKYEKEYTPEVGIAIGFSNRTDLRRPA